MVVGTLGLVSREAPPRPGSERSSMQGATFSKRQLKRLPRRLRGRETAEGAVNRGRGIGSSPLAGDSGRDIEAAAPADARGSSGRLP